jgi:tetratricopeptide (TPR) repeat protein
VTVLYFFILIGLIELPGVLFIAFFFILDVIKQLSPGLFGGREAVAYLAHIGGTVFGVAVTLALLHWRLVPRDQFDAVSLIRQWNRRRQFRDVVASGYNPFDYTPRNSRPDIDPNFEQIQDLRAAIAEALAHQRPDVAADAYSRLRQLDPQQVLSRTNQEELANHYFAENRFADAAESYELFLKHYGRYDSNGRLQLILGLIYARYLGDADRARAHLLAAIDRLHDPNDIEVARAELQRLVGGS